MTFSVESEHLNGIVVLVPSIFEDARGSFFEAYRKDQFAAFGITDEFVQLNHSRSKRGVLRGLHFQWDPPMGKLMRVSTGAAFLVAVDIRKNSPTLGEWFGIQATEANRKQVWAPAGFARGFCALSDVVEVQYQCTGVYSKGAESAIRWNDAEIGIRWPVSNPILSAKDEAAGTLREWLKRPESEFFAHQRPAPTPSVRVVQQ
jgi:dTDP-4-dehydrorhamnose 3,5-epimerase